MKFTPLALLMIASVLTGCSFAPIGENTFECNRKSNPSAYCRSFKALEKSTNGDLPESRFDIEFKMSDYDKATGIAPTDQEQGAVAGVTPVAGGALPHNASKQGGRLDGLKGVEGMPVRRTPVVQRTWIKSFVDDNDMLQGSTRVFKEVQGATWSGFESAGKNGGAGRPVKPHRAQATTNSAPAPSDRPEQTDFSQPSAGDETGFQPPATGSSMPQ